MHGIAFWHQGWADVANGLHNWRLWHLMGVGVLRRRYSRSRIGQFWITLSMGIMVIALGLTWSVLWRVQVADILPLIAVSLVLWTFMTGVLADACTTIINSSQYFLNQHMSVSTPIYSLIYSHGIIMLHNALIILVATVFFGVAFGLHTLLFL